MNLLNQYLSPIPSVRILVSFTHKQSLRLKRRIQIISQTWRETSRPFTFILVDRTKVTSDFCTFCGSRHEPSILCKLLTFENYGKRKKTPIYVTKGGGKKSYDL